MTPALVRISDGVRASPVASVLAAVAVAGVGVVVVARTTIILWRTFFGDPTIYLVYAKNAAHGHPFTFDPGHFSSGTTSPLWGLLLALPYLVGGGPLGAKALSLAVGVAAVAVTAVAAGRVTRSHLGGALGAVWAAVAAAIWIALGYESSLAVAAVAAALWAGDGSDRGARVPWLLAGAWALVVLARPDAAVLVVLQAVALVATRRLRLRAVAVAVAAAAVLPLAYFGGSQLVLGTWSTSATSRAFALREYASRWHGVVYSQPAIHYLRANEVLLVLALVGVALLWREPQRRWIALYAAAGLVAYPILVVVVSPVTWDVERYLLPIAPLVATGIASLVAAVRTRPAAVAAGAAALAVVVAVELAQRLDDPPAFAHSQSGLGYTFDQMVERESAHAVNAVAPHAARVLVYEVQDRYFARPDLRYVSLDGLTDGAVHPYLHSGDMTAFLEHARPDYWIAGGSVDYRPFLKGSILQRVYDRFAAHPSLRTQRVHGITFTVVRRRTSPAPSQSTAWWKLLVRLTY